MMQNLNAGMHGRGGAHFPGCPIRLGSCNFNRISFDLCFQVNTCVLSEPANTRSSYDFSISRVKSVCFLLSSVLRECAGRSGEEGEAVAKEESQTGDQRRQDGEQSSGELTPAASSSSGQQGLFLFVSQNVLF